VLGPPQFLANGSEFRMHLPDGEEADAWLPLLGRQNVANALAAAAAAQAVGTSVDDIVAGLARATPVRGRLRAVPGRNGATIIDDSYNANPGSVRAASDHLAALAGTRILVLGNMAELGPTGPALHKEIGEYARGRCDVLLAIGDLAGEAAKAFGAEGRPLADIEEARSALDPLLASEVTVLVKGSRVMGLDRLVRTLEVEPRAS
jgi:UDP-N-acetylmuramoyl-tripeptide--D-alanyl-D-alanine ligase